MQARSGPDVGGGMASFAPDLLGVDLSYRATGLHSAASIPLVAAGPPGETGVALRGGRGDSCAEPDEPVAVIVAMQPHVPAVDTAEEAVHSSMRVDRAMSLSRYGPGATNRRQLQAQLARERASGHEHGPSTRNSVAIELPAGELRPGDSVNAGTGGGSPPGKVTLPPLALPGGSLGSQSMVEHAAGLLVMHDEAGSPECSVRIDGEVDDAQTVSGASDATPAFQRLSTIPEDDNSTVRSSLATSCGSDRGLAHGPTVSPRTELLLLTAIAEEAHDVAPPEPPLPPPDLQTAGMAMAPAGTELEGRTAPAAVSVGRDSSIDYLEALVASLGVATATPEAADGAQVPPSGGPIPTGE